MNDITTHSNRDQSSGEIDTSLSTLSVSNQIRLSPSAPATKDEFEALCTKIRESNIIIREQAWSGPKTVFFFTDIHDVETGKKVLDRLLFINGLCSFDALGLEGWIDHPESDASKRIRQALSVTGISPTIIPSIDSDGSIVDVQSHKQLFMSFFNSEFCQFHGLKNTRVFGAERNETILTRSSLLAEAADAVEQIIEELNANCSVLLVENGTSCPVYSFITQSLRELGGFENYLSALRYKQICIRQDPTKYVIDPKKRAIFDRLISEMGSQVDAYIGVRNRDAVEKLYGVLGDCTSSVSALVFGLAHSYERQNFHGHSIQHHLREMGFSFAVIDVYSNTEEVSQNF